MNIKITAFFAFVVLIFQATPAANAAVNDGSAGLADAQHVRELFCASKGGTDITGTGTLKTGEDITAVVVCKVPPPSAANAPRATPGVTPDAGLPQLVTAALQPPGGTVTGASTNPVFTTSCSADIQISAGVNLPAVSQGTSTFNCRGYNVGRTSVGCSVQWSGPTSVTVGAEPYGGEIGVNFTCTASHTGAIGTAMDFSYQDPVYTRIFYQALDVTGSINITP